MRKIILAFILTLLTTAALAVNTCDTMPSKDQRTECWSNLIGSYQTEADEYNLMVQKSKKVPLTAKRDVEKKRQAITKDATARCRKDSLGYPESACYINVIEDFKEYTYKETSKYGVADMRLN